MAKNELLVDEIIGLIKTAIPLGLSKIQLSGGEPLLKLHEILSIVQTTKELGVDSTLFTNGYFATESVVAKLVESGLSKVRISIGGSSYAEHCQERHDPQGKESWEKILRAIKLFSTAGVETGVLMPITKQSLPNIYQTAELSKKLGASSIAYHLYIPSGHIEQDGSARLTVEEHYRAMEMILSTRRQLSDCITIIPDYGTFEFLSPQWQKGEKIYPSPCGRTRLGVLADGSIATCSCTMERLDNIRRPGFSLRMIWKKHPTIIEIRNPMPQAPCSYCCHWQYCQGGCRSYSFNNNILGNVAPLLPSLPTTCPAVREFLQDKEAKQNTHDAALRSLRHNFQL